MKFMYFIIILCYFHFVYLDNYRTCQNTNFCLRNLENIETKYKVDNSTIVINHNKIKFNLTDDEFIFNNLQMKIYILKNGIFRLKIKPEEKRFKLKKIDETFNMKSMMKTKDFKIVNKSNSLSIYYYDKSPKNQYFIEIDNNKKTKYELVINYNPFKITYNVDNKKIIEMNSKNMMKIEIPHDFTKNEQEALSSIRMDVNYENVQNLYGLPERGAKINLVDTQNELYRLYNVDYFKYKQNDYMGLYGTWPFILGVSDGYYSGFIWNNPSETFVKIETIDNNKKVIWNSESGIMDISLFADFNLNNFYYKYHKYIGFANLPPMFSLGYHQSRWNYKDLNDLYYVDRSFDDYDIPYDSIWLDIEHTNEKRYLTWDRKFDGIEDFLEVIEEKGRNLVVIIDPHVKIDNYYFLYSEALKNNFLLQFNKNPFEGFCWCKEAVYLDFYNPDVRKYWEKLLITSNFFPDVNNVHVWNDMNEPSVFNQEDLTLPKSTTFNYYNSTYEHRDAHNIYGYLMHKTTFDAMKKKYQRRPFVLTRSFYLGSHKYGAVWIGDQSSTFSDMRLSISMVINNSISGYSFVGADVGGFAEEGEHYLYIRWYQLGVFYPFFRAHSQNETYRREPWLFDDETLNMIRNAIVMRYKLLPYFYFVFFQHFKTGLPILRPLWFKYSDIDPKFMNIQFFFGDSLMIRPIISEKEHINNNIITYLPESERWYNYYDFNEYSEKGEVEIKLTIDRIGVFLKGGSIVPMKWRIRRSSKIMKFEPITLIVALNNEDSASGMVYFDDEESLDYDEENKYYLKKIMFQKNELFIANLHDNFKIANKLERIVILGIKKEIKNIYYQNFYDEKIKNLNFQTKDNNILYINKLNISFDDLWKIKIEYFN